MPGALFALQVDTSAESTLNISAREGLQNLCIKTGMNWGTITIWSCPDSCIQSIEESVYAEPAV